ncbi:hypothetical protein HYPSUDRAFT_78460 [Hypholoma sublateritium FD-334 SS-4]|uniref:Uncharacterized protein n=1 Tax=Hypholoma sublateritium (strain FD-334 SS-4) TaxID=945553 RepID=A0A0D2PJN7_HYPSF|nr:hypothetical protein HYPSUDRAFT_78460 [Hypholoma sublateritium FD-334 SS-4]
MAPLAGKPPFATDEPDSYYEAPKATPRLRQPKPADPNARTSAYDVYNNYIGEDSAKLAAPAGGSARNSGIGAMLLNMGDDSDDDSDDEETYRRRPAGPPGIATPLSKNAALAAATGVSTPPQTQPAPQQQQMKQQQMQQQQQRQMQQQQQQQMQQQQPRQMPQPQQMPHPQQQQQQRMPMPAQGPPQQMPQPIAAPRPGYAAPMAALNGLARPPPAHAPGGDMRKGPAPIQIPPNGAFTGAPAYPQLASPAPSTPHPLQPPMTPITAAFIRPAKAAGGIVNVSFAPAGEEGKATPRKPIMRGNSEETLLPGRGEKGDDFWRRFSMVVKEETKHGAPKESSWLKQTLNGSKRHSRSIWLIGMLLLVLIAGSIGVGVYFTRNSPGHQQPTAIGGSADNLATSTAVATSAGAKASSSSLHVSPTNTVARRDGDALLTPRAPLPTALVARHKHLKNRAVDVW